MIVIGIDPGKKGGVVMLDSVYCAGVNNFSCIMPDSLVGFAMSIKEAVLCEGKSEGVVAYVELVHSMPGQGVTSMFNFGKGFGEILGVLAALNIRTELVSPQKWKRAVLAGTDRDKAAAIRFVQENYPAIDLTPGRCRVPQDGIADAVCIAHYGMLQEIEK